MRFKEFLKLKEEKSKYVVTIKKQLGVPKQLWLGMPVLVSNTKIGQYMIREPSMFYVADMNKHTVTIRASTREPTTNVLLGQDWDSDDEIDMEPGTVEPGTEITISRNDFYRIVEPQGMQAGGGAGGGLGF